MDETQAADTNTEEAEIPGSDSPTEEQEQAQDDTQPSSSVGNEDEDKGNSGDEGHDGSEDVQTDGDRQRPSRTERRIHDVVSKLKEKEAQLDAYRNQYGQLPQDLRFPNYTGREEVTPQELQNDVLTTADQLVQLRLRQAEEERKQRDETSAFINSIDREATVIAKEYPQLDDTNTNTYDPELATAILGSYQELVDSGSRKSLKTHVDSIMKPLLKLQKQTEANTGAEILSQQQRTGLRPTGTKPDISIAKMTADQLERHIRSLNRH